MEIENQMKIPNVDAPLILSPNSSGRRNSSNFSTSPEFEFWMTRNPAIAQPDLVAADDLFVGGVLQPLDLLNRPNSKSAQESELGPGLSQSEPPTVSKRWKDIFKKSSDRKIKNEEKEKKKEKKGGGVNGLTTAELNINIWPFSRSRSAGNSGSKPRMSAPAARKVSSAPCSRSNSAGDSKSRKWPSSPSRGGVHLGRSSPVWQARRVPGGGRGGSEPVVKKQVNQAPRNKHVTAASGGGGAKAKVLNLNVPTCIGYRSHLTCRDNETESNAVVVGGCTAKLNHRGSAVLGGGNISGDSGRVTSSNLFNTTIKGLFSKKVY